MLSILGFIIIILGFFSFTISRGTLSPIYFFWIGFFLLLKTKNKYFLKYSKLIRWAQIGLLINVLSISLTYLNHIFLVNFGLDYKFYLVFDWLLDPIKNISAYLFPYKKIYTPNMTQIEMTYFRVILTSLCEVIIYISIGILLGHLISTKKRSKEIRETI